MNHEIDNIPAGAMPVGILDSTPRAGVWFWPEFVPFGHHDNPDDNEDDAEDYRAWQRAEALKLSPH